MPYYLIENFNKGLDLRKSSEVAPPGSLRVLRNAVINAGGEIEKRKAFVRNDDLTAYGQKAAFKGRIVGPMQVPAYPNMVHFRHHADQRHTDFTEGDGLSGSSYSDYANDGVGLAAMRYWVSRVADDAGRIASPTLLHNASVQEFGAGDYPGFDVDDFAGQVYSVDRYYTSTAAIGTYHYQQYFLIDTGEPFIIDPDSGLAGRGPQMTLKDKSYTISDDILYASAIGDPLNFADAGHGALKISSQGASIGRAMALGNYYGQLAILGARGAQFYQVDPDFAQNQYLRTVETTLFAPRSLTGYADGDLIYLSRTGIRSLQARDSSNLAITSDIGSPIDELIRQEIKYDPAVKEYIIAADAGSGGVLLPIADFYHLAKGIVYPMTGEYWLFLKDKVFVLSRHPGASVMAWSTFTLPEPSAENLSDSAGEVKSRWCADAARISDTVMYRNFADEVFLYGGTSGEAYDDAEVEVVTPFMDMERPGDNKYFTGIDMVCEGEWSVEASTIPVGDGREIPWTKVAEIDGRTRRQFRVPLQMQGMQIALRLTSRTARRATISQMAVFFDMGAPK